MADMTAVELWDKLVGATKGNQIYDLYEIAMRTGAFWQCQNRDDFAWRCRHPNPTAAVLCAECAAAKPPMAPVPEKTVYVGLFLDAASRQRLLEKFPAAHEHVFAEHLTLAFGKDMAKEYPFGETRTFFVSGYAEDAQGQAAAVDPAGLEDLLAPGQVPHVTISTGIDVNGKTVPPKYSKELLAAGATALVYPIALTGVVDSFPRTQLKEVV